MRIAALLLAFASGTALAFTTPPAIDTTPPVITSAPQVLYVSNNSATIRWVTDEIADSTVTYGVTGGPLNLVTAEVLRRAEHLITLTGLAPTTAYSYSVASTDPSGNAMNAGVFNFITLADPDTTPPSFSDAPLPVSIASNSATLGWTVSEPASAVIAYGTSEDVLNQQLTSAEFKTGQGVMLINLAPSTKYFAAVTVTDFAGNSTTSAILSFTTLAPSAGVVVPLVAGFNLTGNGFTAPLDVPTMFGSSDARVDGVSVNVESIWTWNAATQKWKFHTPQFTAEQSAAHALANNHEVLVSVPAGQGYWVNAYVPIELPVQTGTPFDYTKPAFDALPRTFNLLSIGSTLTVQQFNANVGATAINFNALWAWDAVSTKWYFYSPQLEQPGAPFTNFAYCAAHGHQDFAGGTPPAPALDLQPGMGFWVEKN
jgi:chitodextrinase